MTSHRFTRPPMSGFGAIHVDERVARDRNRITGAGVTAGIDCGLMLVRELRGEPDVKSVQLAAGYAPQPPFGAAAEQIAPAAVVDMMCGVFAVLLPERIRAMAGR